MTEVAPVRVDDPIFVVGSARSGTVLVGQVLKGHPKIHCLIERPAVFSYASYLGLNPSVKEKNRADVLGELRDLYARNWRLEAAGCKRCSLVCRNAARIDPAEGICREPAGDLRYADKSHQHVLNVALMLDAFPQARFVHVIRDGRDVVSSMLRHEGVLDWFKPSIVNEHCEWPQPWFGIENSRHYQQWKTWTLAQKRALRWASWVRAGLDAEAEVAPERWYTLRYEDLVSEPRVTVDMLWSWLGVRPVAETTKRVHSSSMGSWRTRLSESELEDALGVMRPVLELLGYETS